MEIPHRMGPGLGMASSPTLLRRKERKGGWNCLLGMQVFGTFCLQPAPDYNDSSSSVLGLGSSMKTLFDFKSLRSFKWLGLLL